MNATLKLKLASHTSPFVPSKLFTAIALAAAALLADASYAMDARYQDKDGDLVADAPTDPKQWVDPSTLVFAYTPVEDPAVYASRS